MFDVVIPARNEGQTIAAVVEAAVRARECGRVLVVDDHSTDETAAVARDAGAEVIPSRGSADKALAMATGVEASSAETLVFFDADLSNVEPQHFESLAEPVMGGEYALVCGVIDYGFRNPLFLRLPPISGLRALRRELFTSIAPARLRGFRVEIMINESAVMRRERTAIRTLRGLRHRTKVQKLGAVTGVKSHLAMTLELLDCFRIVPLWTYPSYLSRLEVLPPV